MNNKGFAITSIIYGLMLLFIVIITSFLSILIGKNRRVDELIEGIYESLEYEELIVKYSSNDKKFYIDNNNDNNYNIDDGDIISETDNVFVTSKKALYHFKIGSIENSNNYIYECSVFLPKSTMIVNGILKSSDSNELLFNLGGSENIDDFISLENNCVFFSKSS